MTAERIAVVGGGPAGATLALRLARLGHNVTLLERGAQPRACDGESFHPGVWPLLEAAGIRNPPGLRIHRTLIRWQSGEVVERRDRVPQLAVLRHTFDQSLLALARHAGAHVRRSTIADLADAGEALGDARMVVDASGRASWSRPERRRTTEPALAIRTNWRGAALPREMRVEALEEGWLWGAPMPDGSFSTIACVDAGSGADESRGFAMLERSLLFRGLRGERTVHCHDATAWAAIPLAGERLLRVGDAAHSLDPLSSSGVRSAMQSALHASIAIHTILRHPERTALALRFWTETQHTAVEEHTRWTRAFYAESRWRDLPFWRARASAPPPLAPAVNGDATVTLAPGVCIGEVPAIVGNLVEARRGITGPAVARPFAWINGIEAARLLAPVAEQQMRRTALLAHWHDLAPATNVAALFDALVAQGLLAAGDA